MKNLTRDSAVAKKQECTVRSLYYSGAVGAISYIVGLVFFALSAKWMALLLWLVLLPCLKWAYLRFFARLSEWKGYGRVEDRLPAIMNKARVEVTYYSLLGCPFCPIVERRLNTLQRAMDFTITTIDLTLNPRMAASNGIRSVPVVEVGGDRLVGNATSEQLAQLIAGGLPPVPSHAS
jgi:glutaredoxin